MYRTHRGAEEQHSKAYCRHGGKWIGSAAPEERTRMMIVFKVSALRAADTSQFIGAPSVTDNTTELLEHRKR